MWIASNTRDATIPPTKNRMPHRSGPIRSSRRGPRRIRNARLKRRWNRFAWRNIIVTYARGPEWYGPTRYTAKSSQNRSSPEPGSRRSARIPRANVESMATARASESGDFRHAAYAIPDATLLLRRTARRNEPPLEVVWTDLIAGPRGPFDGVASTPPYLPGTPRDSVERAWRGGRDGSEVALRFLQDLPRVLDPEGRAYLLLSEQNTPAKELATAKFRVEVLASKALFFERLEVLELRKGLE